MISEKFLEFSNSYGFEYVAEIIDGDKGLYFSYAHKPEGAGFVYLWVEVQDDTFRVVYVGKAGKRIQDRMAEHRGGFSGGSKTGVKNRDLILEGMKEAKRYYVYARKSPDVEILGERVPSAVLEETAFIKKLSGHLWNRARQGC